MRCHSSLVIAQREAVRLSDDGKELIDGVVRIDSDGLSAEIGQFDVLRFDQSGEVYSHDLTSHLFECVGKDTEESHHHHDDDHCELDPEVELEHAEHDEEYRQYGEDYRCYGEIVGKQSAHFG